MQCKVATIIFIVDQSVVYFIDGQLVVWYKNGNIMCSVFLKDQGDFLKCLLLSTTQRNSVYRHRRNQEIFT